MERLVATARTLRERGRSGTGEVRRSRWDGRLAWTAASLLAAWHLVMQLVFDRVDLLGRFDDGIEYTTVTYLLHGQLPITDFYEPYGIGLGVPGAIAHVLGFQGAFALRVTYSIFPVLVTLLVVPIAWRRGGWAAGVLIGLISLGSNIPRYSMGFAALFAFVLLVERAARRTSDGSLAAVTAERPAMLALAGLLLSLAGWARIEYAILGVAWAVWLALFGGGRRRWSQAALALVLALLPTVIVLCSGGATHLYWIIRYNTTSSVGGFSAQRGQPIVWHFFADRLDEIFHLHLASGDPGQVVASYGVAAGVLAAGATLLLLPHRRAALLARDPLRLNVFLLLICAIILYGQAARFSSAYGDIALPVFWLAGMLLLRRVSPPAALVLGLLIAYPVVAGATPSAVYAMWRNRPPLASPAVPGLTDVPIANDGGAASMRTLVTLWRKLHLEGRATLSVGLRNDLAWGNDAIVGFLLNAPSAAWPLTYDPGLVNRSDVERQTVAELCADRAPVVELNGDYPYPTGMTPYVGSHLLDEFLATDYRVRAVAGFYRILLPTTRVCVLPQSLSSAQLRGIRDRLISEGEAAAAGAIALALADRGHTAGRTDAVDAAVAALGGYTLPTGELPRGPLGAVVGTLQGATAPPGLAYLAMRRWPSDLETLAAQTAWVSHRLGGQSEQAAAGAAITQLALRHPRWPQAIVNVSAVAPPDDTLLAMLTRDGASGYAFDAWRRDVYAGQGRRQAAIAADEALIADYVRTDDPVNLASAEGWLAARRR